MSNTAPLATAFHIEFAQVDNDGDVEKEPRFDGGPDRRLARYGEC